MLSIGDYLRRDQIEQLWNEYDRHDLNQALAKMLTGMYASTAQYIEAIGDAFYDPAFRPLGDAVLPDNRERCLVALLAARGAGLTLAVHIYIALMEGYQDADPPERDEITPEEIANIIFLTGVYTGVDNLTRGLDTLIKTLKILADIADSPDPKEKNDTAVLAAIKANF